MIRRFFSVLLTVIMVLSMILTNNVGVMTVYAEEAQMIGTPSEETESGTAVTESETASGETIPDTGESANVSETSESTEEQTKATESETVENEIESRTEETTAESETATEADINALDLDVAAQVVFSNGDVNEFEDVTAAWKAAKGQKATIRLLQSQTVTQALTVDNANSDITLEMADGVKLVGNINGNYSGVILVQGGTLTMKSGIVENTYGTTANATNYGVGVHVAGTGTFNMEGGQVLATGSANAAGIKIRNNSNATVNITGGTVSGTYCGVEIKNGGILSISEDASVSCTSEEGMGVFCIASDSDYSATVNITGGTIDGGSGPNGYGINLLSNKSGAVIKGKISGGNINISGIKVSGADVGLDITGGTINGGVLAT